MYIPDATRVDSACRCKSIQLLLLFCLLSLGTSLAHSQVSTRVSSISPTQATAKRPLAIRAELLQGEMIERVYLLYRPFGSSDYERVEMDVVGNVATATIPSHNVIEPFLECYLVLAHLSGVLESYPLSESRDPFATPPGKTLQIPVRTEEGADEQIVFLSPEPSVRLPAEEVVVAVSLLRADTVVVRRATQILLDGADVTTDALFADDVIVYAPENLAVRLKPGLHRVTVRLFNREGNLYRNASLSFTVVDEDQQLEFQEQGDLIRYGVSIQVESRHEKIGSVGTWYTRGSVQFNASSGDYKFTSNLFITSDEKSIVQPQDRYTVGIESPWVKVGYGDNFPLFPNLILSGKRVRGLSTAVRVGFFNLDLALGKTNRAVDGAVLRSFSVDSLLQEQSRDPNGAFAPISPTTWGKFSYGTYARNLFAVRPSFGSGETWQFGFTLLKSKDDVTSINFGIRPQENLVVGTDFALKLDDKRIELTGQGAFSAFNSDISSGNFTDAYIDSVYPKDASRIKGLRDILSDYITVNDNLKPLAFDHLSTLSYEASLGLNYFDNGLKFSYLFRGSDYNSFGQTFLRKDIQGFNISDRLRLVNNQVFAVLGFERLQDNTSKTRVATTTFTNVNMAVSYYSRTNLPNATIGFSSFINTNGLPAVDSTNAVDDRTLRLYLQSSYDFDFHARHTASFSVSTSNRNDRSVRQYDVKNVTLSLGVATRYTIPLQTSVDIGINLNTLPSTGSGTGSQKLDYTSLSMNARYSILGGALAFTSTFSPTFGDFRRTGLDLGTQWYPIPLLSLELQFSYFDNDGMSMDNIWSFRCRYDL